MAEIKDSSPSINKQESFKPKKIERILNITKDCLEGKTTPIEAFRQIVDRSPQPAELTEATVSLPPQNEIEAEQHQTNQEIEQIRKGISLFLPSKTEREKISNNCLFPEVKTLYDQYHQEYQDKLKKPSEKAKRAVDILKLKIKGVENPAEYYDALRSRGFRPKIFLKETITTKDVKPNELIKAIDRLNLIGIGIGYPPLNQSLENYRDQIKGVLSLDDQQFKTNYNQLNKYEFLAHKYISLKEYNSSPDLQTDSENKIVNLFKTAISPESIDFLDEVNKIDNLKNIKNLKFNEIFSERLYQAIESNDFYQINPFEKDSLIKILSVDNEQTQNLLIQLSNKALSNRVEFFYFYEYYITNVNVDKCSFTESILNKEQESLLSQCVKLEDLSQRQYFLDAGKNHYKNVPTFINENGQITPEFFYNFLIDNYHQSDSLINIPEKILSNFTPLEQSFCKNILEIKDKRAQYWMVVLIKEKRYAEFYDVYCNKTTNLDVIDIPIDVFNHFNDDEKNTFNRLKLLDKKYKKFYASKLCTIEDDNQYIKGDRSGIHLNYIFDKNNLPTSDFYLEFYTSEFGANTDITVPENFPNFNEGEKEIWNKILSIKDINDQKAFFKLYEYKDLKINFLINIAEEYKLSTFFDKDNKFNSLFLEVLIKKGFFIPNYFLNDKNLINFSDQDKTFWSLYRDLSNEKEPEIKRIFFLENKDNFSKFLDENNNFNSLFLESIFEKNIYIPNSLLSDENLQNFSDQDKTMWALYRDFNNSNNSNNSNNLKTFFTENISNFSKFIDQDNHFNSLFLESLITKGIYIPSNILTDENLASFSNQDKTFWSIYRELTNNSSNNGYYEFNKELLRIKDNYEDYFNKDFSPNLEFIKVFLKKKNSILDGGILSVILNTDFIKNRPLEEISFWDKIIDEKNSSSLKIKVLEKFILSNREINNNLIKEADNFISVYEKIENSTSKEIQKIKNQLIDEIIKNKNPLEVYEKISDIFVKNNIPTVGKIYKIFNLLYTPKRINECFRPQNILSPVLSNINNIHRRDIIFRDLIDINLKSGNRSLKNYLQFFANTNLVLDKCFKGNSITPEEDRQLSYFFAKLETLYDNSILGRREKAPKTSKSELKEKVDDLYQKYHVKEGQSISDRVAEIYLSSIGITNIDQALEIVSNSKINTDQRNRNNYINLNEKGIVSNDGALIKGVSDNVLESILDSGSVAREYLGSSSDSDSTPFDTDTIKIDSALNSQNLRTTLSSSPSFKYGSLAIIVKNRGQFQETSKEKSTAKYQPNKLEIFSSGVEGNQHFGVRTGFPSSEIDYIVIQNELSIDDNKLNDIYYQIAKHGTYTPVLNLDGQVIYTPELYDEYRKAFNGVAQFDGKEIKVSKVETNSPFHSQIQEIKKESVDKNKEVIEKDKQIREKVREVLQELNITLKDKYDTSTIGASFQNIGSSGRNTNLPNDFDFDYTLILDGQNYKMANEVKNLIVNKIKHSDTIPTDRSEQIRLSGVSGLGSELIDLDIGINTTADTLIFGSHQAIQEKLESIRNNSGEDVYNEVVANIVLTKKILKENHAYKKGDAQDGGIGGIGVENWILANGGNIENAFKSFWQASHDENGELVPLSEFQKKYPIRDAGENLRESKRSHDNFIYALQEKGYQAMVKTISSYIK